MSFWGVVIAVLGLGILAAAHEIGHFFAAKRLGIKVQELSIFVGPSLVHWNRNDVEYHIRLIPFGAYVRFPGFDEDDEGMTNPDSYLNQPRWKRLLVSLAGPFTNLILGIVIFAVISSVFGFTSTNLDIITEGSQIAQTNAVEGDTIETLNGKRILTDVDLSYLAYSVPSTEPMTMTLRSQKTGQVYSVTLTPTVKSRYVVGIQGIDRSDSDVNKGWEITTVDPTQNGGHPVLKIGDMLLSINGIPVSDPNVAAVIPGNDSNQITVSIIRDGVKQDVSMTATISDTANARGIYIKPGSGFGNLLKHSVLYSVSVIEVSIYGLRAVAKGEIKAQDAIGGPLGIASAVSGVVDAPKTNNSVKVETLGFLAGLISVSLAFTNLLPLPGLDGNAVVLVAIEMIRGKKISIRTESIINGIGFVVLIALVIFAFSSDILRMVG